MNEYSANAAGAHVAHGGANTWNTWPATLPRQARLLETGIENGRTRSLVLDLGLDAQPGQFVMAWLPGLDEKPFSLAAANPVTLTVARVGPFSSALHDLRPGDRLGIRGPFGHGFSVVGRHALLAGGGYGVAPLGFLAKALLQAGVRVTAAIGARTAGDLLTGHFQRLGLEPCVTTEDGSAGIQGRITPLVEKLLLCGEVDTLYACGPNGMLETLEQLSLEIGIPAQLGWEAHMRCGIGICGSCQHGGLLVCRDGPVLPAGAR
jgi:dihydroorotate dehydrogenase electron transfer subunit